MIPETLSVWMQRAGRAEQDGRQSQAILVGPSVAKKLAGKLPKDPKGSNGVTFDSSLQRELLTGSHHGSRRAWSAGTRDL